MLEQHEMLPYDHSQGSQSQQREPRRPHRFTALLLAACVAASSMFGFLGGYAANTRLTPAAPSAESAVDRLAQPLIRTATSGDAANNAGLSIAEVAAFVKPSVVEITTEIVSRSGRMGQLISEGAGSGVILSSDGTIITNNHVIDGAQKITVRLADEREFSAEVQVYDAKTDLAVLKIKATGLMPVVIGDSSTLMVGDTAIAVGNPLGALGGSVTGGIISALDREIKIDGETMSLLQTDAAINPGNSGGGLFNRQGELIGIVNAKSSGTGIEGIGFAIPVNIVKTVAQELLESGYVHGRVATGLTLVDIQDAQSAWMYRVNQLGLYIYKSSDPALQAGDRITAVNGAKVADLAGFNAALSSYAVGNTVSISVMRNGQSVTADIVLTEARG
ncbi:MAG: trypsin-like peptidase domain-containing protein [Peptococcaceae bacterium]|nr:trypsin-like peptidase domain-containing protein [Peptococcaceae bacterium]